MTRIKSTLGKAATKRPKTAIVVVWTLLTLLLFAVDPAVADGNGGGYSGP